MSVNWCFIFSVSKSFSRVIEFRAQCLFGITQKLYSFLVELAESLPGSTQRSPYPTRRRKGSLTKNIIVLI